ncbi:hypothetical protein BC938DRAFT_478204 [Jimgerdemannia flammicorona]|uniref:Arrestin C-terminal-like domain-containing protein n=1 Tax=Jimgerdemannia flammicorona TaxID=994334 RepID=A0A433QYK1_9FUNG|nr:hypothetical protein BC938DRAFT_478204 [Jimgerdemannia flammicorona]
MSSSLDIMIFPAEGHSSYQRGFLGLTAATVSGTVQIRTKGGKGLVTSKLVVIRFNGYEYTNFTKLDPIPRQRMKCGSTRHFLKDERIIWASDISAAETFTELNVPFSLTIPEGIHHSSFQHQKGGVQYDLTVLAQHSVKGLFGSKEYVAKATVNVPIASYLPLVLFPCYRWPLVFFCTTDSSEASHHGFAYDIRFLAYVYGPGDTVQAHIRLRRKRGSKSTLKNVFLGIKRYVVYTDAGAACTDHNEYIASREVGGLQWQTDESDSVGHLDLVTSMDMPRARTGDAGKLKYMTISYKIKIKIAVDGGSDLKLEAPVAVVGLRVEERKRVLNILRNRLDLVISEVAETLTDVIDVQREGGVLEMDLPLVYDDRVNL